jgi:hypothetical protein
MKRKTFNLWKRRVLIAVAVVCAVGFLYVYGWTGLFSITTFTFEGVPEQKKEAITTALLQETKKHTLYVFPGDKALTFSRRRVRQVMTTQLPNTEVVRVSLRGLHTVHVMVIPHVPLFTTGEGKAYDVKGVLYQEQNDISHLPVISFTTSATPTRAFFENLAGFIPQLTTLLFPVGHIIVDEHDDVYMYASGSPSRVMMTKDADVKKIWLSLVSAVDTDPLKTSLEKNKEKLEYIDLRFGNKVFYKFANEGKPAIIAPHATTTATTTPR